MLNHYNPKRISFYFFPFTQCFDIIFEEKYQRNEDIRMFYFKSGKNEGFGNGLF